MMEGNGRNGNLPSSSFPESPRTILCSTQEMRPTAQQELTLSSMHDMALPGSPSIHQLGQMQHLGRFPSGSYSTEPREDLEALLRSREELVREQSRTQQVDPELVAHPGLLLSQQKAINGKGVIGSGFEDIISPGEAVEGVIGSGFENVISPGEAVEDVRGKERLPFQVGEGSGSKSSGGWISLREMLRPGYPKIDKAESLELFRRIVELVDFAHSQDVVLLDIRPSFFYLHPLNKVRYIGSSAKTHFSSSSVPSQTDYSSEAAPSLSTLELEKRWYTCPKELMGVNCSTVSNMYSLGVLLFELLNSFESLEAKCAWMSSLRERILPPKFLAEYPTETGFCLWLLHPDLTSRPTTREILQSELLLKSHKLRLEDPPIISPEEEKAESELLLHFLVSLKAQKMKQVTKLLDDIGILEQDLKELHKKFGSTSSSYLAYVPKSGTTPLRNLNQLGEAYFAVKSSRTKDTDELKSREDTSASQVKAFFNGLCKFSRYSKVEERGSLRRGDLFGSMKVIRSVDLSRDEDYVATAEVSKKIKIYWAATLLDGAIDVHYPVVEMSNNSKLSCICWNRYIRNYIVSTDYDGIVQIWDTNTAQGLWHNDEHQKRAWAVDFCLADPAKFASSSDDCSVKLWHINERNSVSTIRSQTSVCCVQFSPHSADLLAFGCADNKIYCYDLRHTRIPWSTLVGHEKTVSYVKFLNSESIISASTDNTLKLWNLKQTSSEALSGDACALTFRGHTNEKNFVGLSAWDGYIACGSETNEVFTYYKSMPTPIASLGFGSSNTVAGSNDGNEDRHFVSSVCWGQKQGMLLAANSAGNLKMLQMV